MHQVGATGRSTGDRPKTRASDPDSIAATLEATDHRPGLLGSSNAAAARPPGPGSPAAGSSATQLDSSGPEPGDTLSRADYARHTSFWRPVPERRSWRRSILWPRGNRCTDCAEFFSGFPKRLGVRAGHWHCHPVSHVDQATNVQNFLRNRDHGLIFFHQTS